MSIQNSCCGRGGLPWEGRGASLDISGCRFSLYPMDSRYAGLILDALKRTDTSKVWSQSDALSTVYRGKLNHVLDAVGGIFVNAFATDVHMALEGQISKGCPGDTDGDSYLAEDDILMNLPGIKDKHFPVKCKIALYPLGCDNYIDHIAHVFRMAEKAGLSPRTVHYATRIDGDIHAIIDYLRQACTYIQGETSHYVFSFTLSVNSPTKEM